MDLLPLLRTVPDFPKPGILFYDIAPLLKNPAHWQDVMAAMAALVAPQQPQMLLGIESRGFLVAAPLALKLGCGFGMIRKPGKLPGAVVRQDYALEYGQDSIEIQRDSIAPGQRVVIVDDVLATGGTMQAAARLARECGADVRLAAFLLELSFLGGRARVDAPCAALSAVSA